MHWLETVCCILDITACPLLERGIDLQEDVEKLQKEKINNQRTIIQSQSKLIEKKDQELSLVKTTVQGSGRNKVLLLGGIKKL